MATLIPPLTARVVTTKGVNQLKVNVLYVLTDHDGEWHPPKDEERKELAIDGGIQMETRRLILEHLGIFADRGAPLSKKYWKQLGRSPPPPPVTKTKMTKPVRMKKSRQRQRGDYEVEMILFQRDTAFKREYLVQWAGYRPGWEIWRTMGEKGTPLQTWEPLKNVVGTEALEKFKLAPHGWNQ